MFLFFFTLCQRYSYWRCVSETCKPRLLCVIQVAIVPRVHEKFAPYRGYKALWNDMELLWTTRISPWNVWPCFDQAGERIYDHDIALGCWPRRFQWSRFCWVCLFRFGLTHHASLCCLRTAPTFAQLLLCRLKLGLWVCPLSRGDRM